MSLQFIPTFLPGALWIEPGSWSDYRELEAFHYRPGKPATSADVWTVRYGNRRYATDRARQANAHRGSRRASDAHPGSRAVAVGVLSYPVPSCKARRRALGITGSRIDELRFANEHIRTISRVIVHPQFRALGLAVSLVRWMCRRCPTRYVEAMAAMGHAHPLFQRAGMARFEPTEKSGAVYYLFDRESGPADASDRKIPNGG
jgi:ABC-type ATPase with predicted acetyltransferase domain